MMSNIKNIASTFRSIFIMLWISLFISISTSAQVITSSIDKDSITVGDLVEWHWHIELPQNLIVTQWPNIPDTLGPIHVVKRDNIDTVYRDGQKVFSQKLFFSGYDSLDASLPQLTFQYVDLERGDSTIVVSNNHNSIKVRLVDVDVNDTFKPIKEIQLIDDPNQLSSVMEKVVRYQKAIIILSILIGLLIIVWAFYLLYKSKKRTVIIELPYNKAKRKMNELEALQLWEKGEYKMYYSELSDLLKEYIKDTMAMPTDQLTSSELVKIFKKEKNLRGLHKPLRDILLTADITKFAKGVPHEDYKIKAISDTEIIINSIEQIKLSEKDHDQ